MYLRTAGVISALMLCVSGDVAGLRGTSDSAKLSSVADLAPMFGGTCVVRRIDSQMYCWGSQDDIDGGWLPAALVLKSPQRVVVALNDKGDPSPVVGVSGTGSISGSGCAIMHDNRGLRCWGANEYGQAGVGFVSDYVSLPVSDDVMTGVTDFALGDSHTCALREGSVYCWGLCDLHQCGRPASSDDPFIATVPVSTEDATLVGGVTKLTCFMSTCCAIKDGELLCWGDNYHNVASPLESADGEVPTPSKIVFPLAPEDYKVEDVAISSTHGCAVMKTSGHAYCWGYNTFGQLSAGNHEAGPRTPQRVLLPSDARATKVAVSTSATCFILTDGNVACAGSSNVLTPLALTADINAPMVFNVSVTAKEIVAGAAHFCVVDVEQLVTCWGDSSANQLGGSTYPSDSSASRTFVKFE